jgi:hypothetical protein
MILFIRIIHYLIELFYSTYIFIFPKKYDIYFAIFIFLMTFHWLIFRNECILSVIEKKLENSKYILGTDPYKHIYRDVCPKYIFVITSILLFVNLFVVLYRSSDSKLITFLIIISIIIIIYYKLIYKHEPKQDLEK